MKQTQQTILNIDRSHIWHPFTQMKDYEKLDPLVITKAKGFFLYDYDGKKYYDTISSWWTNLLGHQHPFVKKSIKKQLDKLDHVNFSGVTHPYATELIARLKGFLPQSLSRYFFSDNGSTAVEVALKIAFQYFVNEGNPNKSKFVMLEHAYHGDTIGAVSLGGVDLYHQLYAPLLFEAFKAKSPNCSACPLRQSEFTLDATATNCNLSCFNAMEELIQKNKDQICAVIVEPLLQGAGGMLTYPALYLQKLRAITQENNILLIFDEVATGFGRTGSNFAFEKAGVVPDIICLSKALTAGMMPLALTVTNEAIFQAFYADYFAQKTFYHGHSYTANPIACSAANATLTLLKQTNLPYSNHDTMLYFQKRLRDLAAFDFVGDIRYQGFIGAIDLVLSRKNNIFLPEDKRIGFQVYLKSLEQGLVLRPLGNTIYWFLPINMTINHIRTIMDKSILTLESVMQTMAKG
jgi:adenosylmethionine-8-amino-7-oxononanoate aminotransferase